MKRAIALMIAVVMTLGAYGTVFAQTVTRGVGYNIVVNGQTVVFSDGDAINVDGVSMFTADCFVQKFSGSGLTAENVGKASSFSFEGKEYYAMRDVAEANALNVYWDKATRTALIVNKDKYEKIKELLDASNANQADVSKMEMEFDGSIKMSMTASGQTQALDMPISGVMKMDLDAKFMEYNFKTSLFGSDMNMHVYDNGEFMYTNSGEETWYKMESQIANSAEMMEQVTAMSPSLAANAEDLSIAGLKITESGGIYTLEGNMYVSETFSGLELDKLMGEAYSSMGIDIDVNFNWPDTIYVKYVLDGDGTIKSMSMKFDMDFSMAAEGETVEIGMAIDLNMPKFILDGEIDTTVPQSVVDSATDFADAVAE